MANIGHIALLNRTALAGFSLIAAACGSIKGEAPASDHTSGETSSGASSGDNDSASSGTSSTTAGTSSTAPTTGASGASSTSANTSSTSGGSGSTSSSAGTSGSSGSSSSAPTSGPSGAASSTSGESTSGETGEPTSAPVGSLDDYNPEFKEFVGEDCEVAEAMDVNNPKLPNPFLNAAGEPITKKSEWACQRAYIKKAVEKYIHGTKPGTPDVVTGEVTNNSISVHVEHAGKSVDFSVSVSLPNGADGPVPIIIGLGGVAGVSPGNDNPADFAGTIKAEGVATGNYNHNNISSEMSRSGLFQNIYGNTNASAQVGWAWGISRVLDVLVSEKAAGRNEIIDPTAVGVTGCSRNGKGAFTVGAFDERIALGLPQESGTAGVSALRIVNTRVVGPNNQPSESIMAAKGAGSAWFGPDFDSNYSTKVNTMPVDMHSLVAMYAPRGLLVLDNSRIGELGSTAQHAATVAGGQVHKALGVEKNAAYHGGNPSDPHRHCAFYQSQVEPLQRAIRGHLTRTAEPDGRMEPQPVAVADLEEWIDWETPTLE